MKTKKLLFVAVLAVMMSAFVSPASAKGKINVYPYLNTDYAIVAALNEEMADFSVEINTFEGKSVYSSGKVNGAHFNKVMDFSKLADGNYIAALKRNGKTFLKDVFVVSGGKLVKKVSDKPETEMAAKVWTKSNYLFVSYLNKSFDPSSFIVEDAFGNVLFKSTLPEELTYSGKFDVSLLPSGTYYVNLVSGQNENRYAIRK